MASFVFNTFKTETLKGEHNLSAAADGTYTVSLVNTSAFVVSEADENALWQSVSATWDISLDSSFSAVSYTNRGLSGCTVVSGTNEAQWDADDITWASSSIDARGAVIWKTATGNLICAIDFAAIKTSSNGDFSLVWNAEGIINLA